MSGRLSDNPVSDHAATRNGARGPVEVDPRDAPQGHMGVRPGDVRPLSPERRNGSHTQGPADGGFASGVRGSRGVYDPVRGVMTGVGPTPRRQTDDAHASGGAFDAGAGAGGAAGAGARAGAGHGGGVPHPHAAPVHGHRNQPAPGVDGRPVLLTPEQVEAAVRMSRRMLRWNDGERALGGLRERFEGFEADAVLLKIIAVNSLAGPSVLNKWDTARHFERVLGRADLSAASVELIERLSAIPSDDGKAPKQQHSFASKFAHYFLDRDRFPVLDGTTQKMLRLHLGSRSYVADEGHKYREFEANFRRLRGLCGYQGPKRHLTRYLWIAGQVREKRRKPRSKINPELSALMKDPSPEVARDLEILAPKIDPGSPWL